MKGKERQREREIDRENRKTGKQVKSEDSGLAVIETWEKLKMDKDFFSASKGKQARRCLVWYQLSNTTVAEHVCKDQGVLYGVCVRACVRGGVVMRRGRLKQ
jgi:hypothetical protein